MVTDDISRPTKAVVMATPLTVAPSGSQSAVVPPAASRSVR
jgi:hypothetical protein